MKVDRWKSKFHFLDNKIAPPNLLDVTYKQLTTTRRFLKNFFPKKEDFSNFLEQGITNSIETENLSKRTYNKDALKKVVDNLFKRLSYKVGIRQLEEFFMIFDYNTRGNVNHDDLLTALYDETDKDFMIRIQKRPKGPPPVYDRENLGEIILDPEIEYNKELMKDPTKEPTGNMKSVLEKMDNG